VTTLLNIDRSVLVRVSYYLFVCQQLLLGLVDLSPVRCSEASTNLFVNCEGLCTARGIIADDLMPMSRHQVFKELVQLMISETYRKLRDIGIKENVDTWM
jgi:hypothetical protein